MHRGTIVNLEFVSKISKNKQDKLMVHLDNDTTLSVSRNHINLFKKNVALYCSRAFSC
ncbi:LytTR family DNA-binding domain-containing protein [Isorropodon fossajaponicum symbiont]|uniref:LytTR family transcriptional regulator DNA-binding domain-containing protein n=1 Tax=Isorropodon fossajaponicum symbiont TaxID=883811 RepID=UPI001CECA2DB